MLYANWELLSPYVALGIQNPFANIFLISGYIPTSKPDDPHYRKTYWDLAFLAYYVIFFSFVREMIAIYVSKPAARYFGLKRASKIDRFGEQTYALFYFMIYGAWGYVRVSLILSSCLSYHSQAHHVSITNILVQHWSILGWWVHKCFMFQYLPHPFSSQIILHGNWSQSLNVITWCNGLTGANRCWSLFWGLKNLAKIIGSWPATILSPCGLWGEFRPPHSTFHIQQVLYSWSYVMNLTWIGNAVYMSMDIPDAFLAVCCRFLCCSHPCISDPFFLCQFSKLLNYIQWDNAKVYAFVVFFGVWTYVPPAHHLLRNMNILQVLPPPSQHQNPLVRDIWTTPCSVRTILVFFLVLFGDHSFSEWTKHWNWSEGVYMVSWLRSQIFLALFLLQLLNVFWYYLMIKILIRLDNFLLAFRRSRSF